MRSKQSIKIEKPFQSLLTFSHNAGEKKYSSECFVVIFLSFYFLSALQSDINSNKVYVLGHKYVLGPFQTHFSPSRYKLYCYIAWRATEFAKRDFPLASKGCIQKILLYVAGLSIYNYIIIWFEKTKVLIFFLSALR